jgi:hypothetical protein
MSCSRTLARPEIPLDENNVSQDLALLSQRGYPSRERANMDETQATIRVFPPRWLRIMGWIALPGTLAFAVDLIWEQTLLTWQRGPQMVGFALTHAHTGLFIFMVLSALTAHLLLFCVLSLAIRDVIRRTPQRWSNHPTGAPSFRFRRTIPGSERNGKDSVLDYPREGSGAASGAAFCRVRPARESRGAVLAPRSSAVRAER